jgi:hypothetical protein
MYRVLVGNRDANKAVIHRSLRISQINLCIRANEQEKKRGIYEYDVTHHD